MKTFKLSFLCCLLFCSQLLFAQLRAKEGKGYFNITNVAELQYLQSIDSSAMKFASGYIKTIGFSANTINGIFLNPNLSLGLGIGIQITGYKARPSSFTPDSSFSPGYFENKHSMSLLPIFADFRFYPGGTAKNLLFILDVGYAPLLKIKYDYDKESLDGGALVKLGAAYRIPLGSTVSFLPSLNFNAQRFGDNTALGANVALGLMF